MTADIDLTEFPTVFRDAMVEAGYTQRSMAAALTERGLPVSKDTVGLWVNGKQEMKPREAFMFEDVCGKDPGELTDYLGYIPSGARATVDPKTAVRKDKRLGREGKSLILHLIDYYRTTGQ